MKSRREIGLDYEEIAMKYLVSNNLEFVTKNYYTRYGEIDLIFFEKKSGTLVFVEVKYRKNIDYGSPVEVVDKRKIEKILMTSKIYLSEKKWKNSIRYDIIGITRNKQDSRIIIDWIKNAF